MIQRTIKTHLLGKEDIFKMLAIGEATKMPVLFLGVPGVGKTQALLDYAAAMFNHDRAEVRKNSYILETDEGTRTSEVKGRVNMAKLLEEKKYEVNAPICDAQYVLINEIDKGSSGVRNTMLSVMRERALFYGDEIKKCAWKLFAASCNEIPEDEKDSPFWDRFIMKYQVERVGAGRVKEMWDCVYGAAKCTFEINVPSAQDVKDCNFNEEKLHRFTSMIYEQVSDRTLAQIPKLCKAIKLVYGCDDIKSIMVCATMLCPEMVPQISEEIEDPRVVEIKTLIVDVEAMDYENDGDYIGDQLNSITDKLDLLTQDTTDPVDAETLQELGTQVSSLLTNPDLGTIWKDWNTANNPEPVVEDQVEYVEPSENGQADSEPILEGEDVF